MATRAQVLPFALHNALQFGKADAGAVLGRVMGAFPETRVDVACTRRVVNETIAEVNALPPDTQKALLAQHPLPVLAEKKAPAALPELPGAAPGKVITRFAPAPTGALTLLHVLRPIMANYLYAQQYNGKFYVRLEDTDPAKVEAAFYGWIEEDLKALGVRWDKTFVQSDDMEHFYRYAGELVKNGLVYACFCDADVFKKQKLSKKPCSCRAADVTANKAALDKAVAGRYKEGAVVFRLKTAMDDPNPAVRDPPLLRVSHTPHPLKRKTYALWPLYNFANVVEDHLEGITHVFRGKEHQNNSTIQERLYAALGWKQPVTINFGMIALETGKIHKRDIRQLLKEKKISGWDDPSLPTVRALLRRGFQPEAFKQAALTAGLTKNDITFTLDKLETANRRLIDPQANRYMVVRDPVQIRLVGAEAGEVQEALHPDFPGRGKKTLPLKPGEVYLSKGDVRQLKGKPFRLKGFGNVFLKGKTATYMGNELVHDMPKIQWASRPHIHVTVMAPDGPWKGVGEPAMADLKPGQLIQMERIGFARVDRSRPLVLWFAHR